MINKENIYALLKILGRMDVYGPEGVSYWRWDYDKDKPVRTNALPVLK